LLVVVVLGVIKVVALVGLERHLVLLLPPVYQLLLQSALVVLAFWAQALPVPPPITAQILFLVPLHLLVAVVLAIIVLKATTAAQVAVVDGLGYLVEQGIRLQLVHRKEITAV
jgi:hypothetical protein